MKQIYKKENRILLSMITGMIVISLFCFSEWDQYGCDVEKFPSEQRPKISFWLAKAIERW